MRIYGLDKKIASRDAGLLCPKEDLNLHDREVTRTWKPSFVFIPMYTAIYQHIYVIIGTGISQYVNLLWSNIILYRYLPILTENWTQLWTHLAFKAKGRALGSPPLSTINICTMVLMGTGHSISQEFYFFHVLLLIQLDRWMCLHH